jgi:uncharacterized RDD family membrane protein YckC
METAGLELSVKKTEYPFLSDRVQSTFIDTIFIVVLMFIFASWLNRYDNAPDWIRIALFFGLWAVYEPLATSLGGTIGNYLKGIRVRKFGATEKKINFFEAFLRYLLKISLGWISFLTIHSNKEKRAIHDLAAGSVMIRK